MRILFLTDNFPPERNAPASRTFEHARRWVASGDEVTVVTTAPNFPEGKVHAGYRNRPYQVETREGIRVVRVWSYMTANEGFVRRALDYASFLASGTMGGIAQPRPDVVVATSPQFFTAIAGWAVAAIKRCPFVFEVRDIWPEEIIAGGGLKPGRVYDTLEQIELFLYRRAARIVVVTEAFRDNLMRRGVPPAKISVVRNAADLDQFTPRPPDESLRRELGLDGRFVVTYLGTHGMGHGLETLLDAAHLLRDEPIEFLLVGSGARKRALIERARAMNLDAVRFLDARPRADMPALWSVADATVVLLRREPAYRLTVPSKIFEAMAMGVPIVLGVEGEAKEIVEEAAMGLCVTPENPEEMAAAIRRLRTEPALRAELRAGALAAAPRFSRETAARELRAVLGQLAPPR